MGITIHYKAKFGTKHSMREFIDETVDIAKTLNWKFTILEDREFPAIPGKLEKDCDLFGLLLTPTGCETLDLCFHGDRRLINITCLQVIDAKEWKKDPSWIYTASCKTQFGGPAVHKQIVLLIKYLSKKYFDEIEMNDETDYWKSGDEEKLNQLFGKMSRLITMLKETLDDFPIKENEDVEDYFKRILGKSVEIRAVRIEPKQDDEIRNDN